MDYQKWGWIVVLMGGIAGMAGCGGGSTSNAVPAPPGPPAPSLSGVFVDDPVAGLSYATSSGYSGTTDAKGNFKYNSGDTITFKIGNLTLGAASGGNTISPVDLSANSTVTSNLYVLLQSLDNKSAANVITVPPALATADLSGINLTQASATFASSGNAALLAAQASAGISTGIVSSATALARANAQFQRQSAGVWQLYDGDVAQPIIFRLDASGGYVMGQASGTTPGIEQGTLVVDPLTAHFAAATIALDTNADAGLSDLSPAEKLETMKLDGPNITVRDAAGAQVFQFRRVASDASSVVGVWALNSTTSLATQHFVFWADGHYMMLDPVGNTGTSHCGSPGIEYGTYTFVASSGTLTATATSVDTNGCGGLHDTTLSGVQNITGRLAADGSTFTVDAGTVLMRVAP